ncbi:transglycosylase domain-containing protein [Neolewinella lacunae]|uniref:Transglycosylase domain-containing protein n=1 Tax=Neolewinella lacunae TaxID=1517758 RepID=A0A923TA62_9BACT|nr:transglycosylase domain-containing protein [Neolewinella lacunae]MBC6996221.1 transglycosylase domain-containing protein [Neolewinella lacunae]MDN3637178.1 transglycosylase domain-containing protein [Neolewinella lacunae]
MDRIKEFLFKDIEHAGHRRTIQWLWRGILLLPIVFILLFLGLSFTDLPSVEELENPKNNEASRVLAEDGSILGRYFLENRVMVDFDELGPYLEPALVATEDERYYQHSGIDYKALARAVVKTGILRQSSSGGGSTITQQLAKLLFTEGGEGSKNIVERLFQKLQEWIIAVRLERKYTKQEIIAMYLNRYDFINGAQGIRAASENYFGGKRPHELEPQEAATLVGMLKNASLYNPLRREELVRQRRNTVLAQMKRNNYLTQEEFDRLSQLPLGIKFSRQMHDDGAAPYFRMVLKEEAKKILSQPQYAKSNGDRYDIDRDGLTFHTTINPAMQRHAEEQALIHMKKLQKEFFNHWRKLDPWTYESPSSKTEIPVELRQESLQREIRRSDRYQQLRASILLPVLQEINTKNDLTFHEDDREVARMMQELKEPGTLRELVRADLISNKLADKHQQVMKLPEFKDLETAWEKLQAKAKTEFDKPVKMRVFTYDRVRMETDTTMTPLDSIRYHKMILQIGSMSMEPQTGFVKTWVGGTNFKWFQFDHVTTHRQVGSTFKPFVYAASVDLRGISPCFEVLDQPITIAPGDGSFYLQEPWTPRNANNVYSGQFMNLYHGLANSVNTVSAYLMQELGSTEPVRNLVASMGIQKEDIPAYPSIALGAVDLTVQQMTGAYTTFGNNGVYQKPVFLTKIVDRTGRVVYEYVPDDRRAISPAANYVMLELLRKAAGGGLTGIKGPVGGKTGTTNDQTDGWFMGVTPELVVGTWVGGDARWLRFRDLGLGSGAHMAKPFFREFVKATQSDESIEWDTKRDFTRPKGDLGIELNCGSYNGNNDDVFGRQDSLFLDDQFGGGINNNPDF